jgi:hypothetical protein
MKDVYQSTFFVCFLSRQVFELRAPCLQGRLSTIWATPPVQLVYSFGLRDRVMQAWGPVFKLQYRQKQNKYSNKTCEYIVI